MKLHYAYILTVAPELPVPDNLITILDPSSKNILIPWKVIRYKLHISKTKEVIK